MALNLAQALGILVQSAQAHLNGELLISEQDKKLLTEAVNVLMQTEEQLEKDKNEKQSTGDGPSGDSISESGDIHLDPII
jgi:hypothetical protein